MGGGVEHPHELAEVLAHRGVQVGLPGAPLPPGGLGIGGELEVLLGERCPRVEPVLPALDPTGRTNEVVVVDARGDYAGRPVVDRGLDARVGHQPAGVLVTAPPR